MKPRSGLPLRLSGRVPLWPFALALCAAGCDEVMHEALSPASAMELQPPPAERSHEAPLREPLERPVVAILPMGKVRDEHVAWVASAVEGAMQVRARVEPGRPLPKEAYYAPRKRWRAEKILDAVDAQPPEGAWKVVVVTDAEISTTKGDVADWGIGGLGNIGGRSCVVSSHLIRRHTRARPEVEVRLRKLAVHEFGHTLGLPHCEVVACVMSDARGKLLRSLDGTTDRYCGRCRKVLPQHLLTQR